MYIYKSPIILSNSIIGIQYRLFLTNETIRVYRRRRRLLLFIIILFIHFYRNRDTSEMPAPRTTNTKVQYNITIQCSYMTIYCSLQLFSTGITNQHRLRYRFKNSYRYIPLTNNKRVIREYKVGRYTCNVRMPRVIIL